MLLFPIGFTNQKKPQYANKAQRIQFCWGDYSVYLLLCNPKKALAPIEAWILNKNICIEPLDFIL